MTKNGWRLVCLALLATAWGLNEVIGGETVWLTAWALLVLAAGRALVNRPGSSTALAAVAVLFKSVNAAPFHCHLAGIALLGIAFDAAATLLWREDRRAHFRAAAVGVIGAYLSALLFAVSMVWVFEYGRWAGGGLARVGEHVLYSGSRGALAGALAAPLGLFLGRLLTRRAELRPRVVIGAAAAACLALWALGPFVG